MAHLIIIQVVGGTDEIRLKTQEFIKRLTMDGQVPYMVTNAVMKHDGDPPEDMTPKR